MRRDRIYCCTDGKKKYYAVLVGTFRQLFIYWCRGCTKQTNIPVGGE